MKEELLVDSYYMYNFSGANSRIPPLVGRSYDVQPNSFTLSYAKVAFEVDADPVTVRADLGYGQLANLISGGTAAQQLITPLPQLSTFAAQQAYASLKVPGTQLTIDFGRFNTTAGAEVIEANRNWIYSRSLLFAIIPVTHTGLRLGYKVNDLLSLQASLVNGLSNDSPDLNKDKTGGVSVTVNPLPTTSIIATTYFGKENPEGSATNPVKFTGDLVVSHNLSDQLGLNLNFDYIKQGDFHATGAALMGRYIAAEHLTLAARAEFLSDKGILFAGITDTQSVYEGTVTLGVPFAGHFEMRAEVRGDFSNKEVFPADKGAVDPVTMLPGGADFKKQQVTGTVAFLGFIQ